MKLLAFVLGIVLVCIACVEEQSSDVRGINPLLRGQKLDRNAETADATADNEQSSNGVYYTAFHIKKLDKDENEITQDFYIKLNIEDDTPKHISIKSNDEEFDVTNLELTNEAKWQIHWGISGEYRYEASLGDFPSWRTNGSVDDGLLEFSIRGSIENENDESIWGIYDHRYDLLEITAEGVAEELGSEDGVEEIADHREKLATVCSLLEPAFGYERYKIVREGCPANKEMVVYAGLYETADFMEKAGVICRMENNKLQLLKKESEEVIGEFDDECGGTMLSLWRVFDGKLVLQMRGQNESDRRRWTISYHLNEDGSIEVKKEKP